MVSCQQCFITIYFHLILISRNSLAHAGNDNSNSVKWNTSLTTFNNHVSHLNSLLTLKKIRSFHHTQRSNQCTYFTRRITPCVMRSIGIRLEKKFSQSMKLITNFKENYTQSYNHIFALRGQLLVLTWLLPLSPIAKNI